MKLKVNFRTDDDKIGTACLIENLITNEVQLDVYNKIQINELQYFVDKAIKILKLRYNEDIEVYMNWDSLREEDLNVITGK